LIQKVMPFLGSAANDRILGLAALAQLLRRWPARDSVDEISRT
jgi:hypothetical protein